MRRARRFAGLAGLVLGCAIALLVLGQGVVAGAFAQPVAPVAAAAGSGSAAAPAPGAEPPAAHRRGAPSTNVTIAGAVKRPGTWDLDALRRLPKSSATLSGRTYTGVNLWALLDEAGLDNPTGKPNGVLDRYVVATGTDGYRVVIAMGEIAPAFGNAPDLVALEADGRPLERDGFARLVVPSDAMGGRSVANLVRLEVIALPDKAH